MNTKSEIPVDVKLFIDLALWFGKKREMTVNQFLSWFTSYLSTDNKDYFKRIVPFFMEEQQCAEITLCELLERDYLQKKKIRTIGSKITRHIDWPRTYAKAIPYLPVKYHGVEIQTQLDISLLGALAGIAEEWQIWLETIGAWSSDSTWQTSPEIKAINRRALKLKKAIGEAKKRGAVSRSYALSAKHRQIILNFVEPENKEAFLKSLNRWSDYSVKDLSSVIAKVERIILKMVSDNANLDNLFEATSHLSILKAATESSSNWTFVATELSVNNKAIYNLKRGDINFRLGKGNPKHLFENSKYAKPDKYSERMLQLRELAGQTGSGYQPDIVMGFYHDHGDHDEKNPHVIFGDAKRYPESGIAGAYKSTIASTMIAYGHWGKLEIKAEPCWDKAFRAPVQPFFTLFFVPSSKDGKIRKQQILADFPIREFTLQQMQAPFVKEQPPCHQKETQDENTDINAWFKKITEQIEKLFSVEII